MKGLETNLAGKNLGAYRLIEQVGRGGMAIVYKAYEPALDRYVAVKVLPEYFAHDPEFFPREFHDLPDLQFSPLISYHLRWRDICSTIVLILAGLKYPANNWIERRPGISSIHQVLLQWPAQLTSLIADYYSFLLLAVDFRTRHGKYKWRKRYIFVNPW